jgi:hypothetical protein
VVGGKLRHGSAGGEERIQRQPGIGPLRLGVQVVFDEGRDPLVSDDRAAFRERAVILDELLVYAEDIHAGSDRPGDG